VKDVFMFHALFREIEPQPLGVARWGIAPRSLTCRACRAPARRAQLPGDRGVKRPSVRMGRRALKAGGGNPRGLPARGALPRAG
jgi:hypothetical protein